MFPDTESLPHDEPDCVGADRVGADRVGADRVGADRVGAGRFGIGRAATLLADPRSMGDLDESRGYSPADFEKTD